MNNNQVPLLIEERFGKQIDKCFTDSLLKTCGGLLIGSILSLTLFKRRSWPITIGAGFGLGVAYRSCEKSLNAN